MIETLKELYKTMLAHIPKGFYGKVVLKFENGKLIHFEKTESIQVR